MFVDKVILISGCSSGLGRYLAENLEKKGYKIYAGVRDAQKRKDLSRVWKNTHPNIVPIKLDIDYNKSCCFCVNKIIKKEKHIDVLINNAAYMKGGLAMSFDVKDFIKILNTNVVGAFRLIKKIIPYMIKNGGGKIINITSLNGTLAVPNDSFYCSSKFALEALGLSMRHEVFKNNIWITNLAPGIIKFNKNGNQKKFLKSLIPMASYYGILKKIDWIIKIQKSPARVSIGLDSFIFSSLQRILPNNLFNFFIGYIWNKKLKSISTS